MTATRSVSPVSASPGTRTYVGGPKSDAVPTPDGRFWFSPGRLDPRLLAVAGAACIGLSAMFVKLSETSPATAAVFRCGLALPILLPLVLLERRRLGPRPVRRQALDLLAGALLGIDFMLWTQAITSIGAGLATVVVNVQVVVVPLLAWLFLRERPAALALALVPLMLAGVALAGGVLGGSGSGGSGGSSAGGSGGTNAGGDPTYGLVVGVGAGVAYAGYLVLLRLGSQRGYRAYPVFTSTLAAFATAMVVGLVTNTVDFTPGWRAVGWLALLSISGQVLGWLLLSAALPRLRSSVGATLLLTQPILAMLLGAFVLGELPGFWQYVGSAVVIVVVWLASRTPTSRRTTSSSPPQPTKTESTTPGQINPEQRPH